MDNKQIAQRINEAVEDLENHGCNLSAHGLKTAVYALHSLQSQEAEPVDLAQQLTDKARSVLEENEGRGRVAVAQSDAMAWAYLEAAQLIQDAPAPEILHGPRTHICWTPDHIPKDEREEVVLIRYADYKAMRYTQPPKAQMDGGWRDELEAIAEILDADGDEWNCAARLRRLLSVAPAKAQIPEDCVKISTVVKPLKMALSHPDEYLRSALEGVVLGLEDDLHTAAPKPPTEGERS